MIEGAAEFIIEIVTGRTIRDQFLDGSSLSEALFAGFKATNIRILVRTLTGYITTLVLRISRPI